MAYASAHLYRNYGVTKNISSKRCAGKQKKLSPSSTSLPYLSQRQYKQAVLFSFWGVLNRYKKSDMLQFLRCA